MTVPAVDLALLSRLLDEALDIRVEAREAWLAALPEESRHLVATLRDLLAESDRARTSGFLSSLPSFGESGPADAATAQAGELVGTYRLIREIGRGGMGEVWLAERADGAFRRQVALKLPRLAWGAGLAQRMAREREIGALLEHPNIARLYDAGVDDGGRPYLAFEYIDGQAIDAWCDTQNLSIPERLRLVVQVTRAVAYAHGRLVVHRDLKPSNVLVTADGQALLLDFGIAKLLLDAAPGEPGLTQEQGRVLTPHFASPEQMRGGAITVQSDIYSLGVVAYGLLTGATPYAPKRKTLGALEDAVLEGEPALASTRARTRADAKRLKGEIDSILAKALRRDPIQRYPTADALATDIERHLAGERVLAQPDSTWYRLRKTIRRHRTSFAATGAVTIAIISGGAAAIVQAHRAARSAERERVVKEFVTEVFRVNSRNDPANSELRKLPAEMLLEHGASLIQQRFPGQPELQAELYGVVGGIFADMGANKLAADYSTRQIEALTLLDADKVTQAHALVVLARALYAVDRLADAELRLRKAVTLAGGDAAVATEALVLLARVQWKLGHQAESRATQQAAVERLGTNATVASPARAWLKWLEAAYLTGPNRFDKALPKYREAIDIALRSEGPTSPTAVDMRLALGSKLIDRGLQREAVEVIAPALAILESSGGPEKIRAAQERAFLWMDMYEMTAVSPDEAMAALARSQAEIDRQPLAVPEVIRAGVQFSRASVLKEIGQVAEAMRLMTSACEALRKMVEDPMTLAWIADNEAQTNFDAGLQDKADRLFRERLRLMKLAGRATSSFGAYAYANIAFNATTRGRFEDAQAILDAAPEFLPDVANPGGGIGYSQAVDWERARLAFARHDLHGALERMSHLVDDDTMEWASSTETLRSEIYCASGRAPEGLALIRRVIEAQVKHTSYAGNPGVARVRAVAGLCALQLGNRREAARMSQLAHAAFELEPVVSQFYRAPLADLDDRLRKF